MSETIEEDEMTEKDEEAPLLELEDVSVHFDEYYTLNPFKSPETVHAVDDVNLEIEEEDMVVLVGESGSGKTTLGKTVIGLERPTDGTVSYRGQDIWVAKDGSGRIDIPYPDIRKSLQIIHQDPSSALNESQTVLNTLSEPLRLRYDDLDLMDRRQRIYSVLEELNLSPPADYASRYPHQLSGGEKQRIVLARALLMDPDLILADEAVSALDVSMRVETMDLMLVLQEEFEMSYLFISHNLANARYLAERADGRIGVMYLGRLVELGTPEQLIENPKHPYTQILRWATPSLSLLEDDSAEASDPPVRAMDVPDAIDPPSGCRFHTRCPFAREACKQEIPPMEANDGEQEVACFRQDETHEYWDSELIDPDAAKRAREQLSLEE